MNRIMAAQKVSYSSKGGIATAADVSGVIRKRDSNFVPPTLQRDSCGVDVDACSQATGNG